MMRLVFAVMLSSVVFVLGCGSNSAEGVVEAWGKALINKDLEKASTYLKSSDPNVKSTLSTYTDAGMSKIEIISSTPIGDGTTVVAALTFREATVRFGCTTTNVDGTWKITFCSRLVF